MRPGFGTVAVALAAAAAIAGSAAAEDAVDPFADRWLTTGAVRLEALDKVTGRVSSVEAPVDRPIRFGTLDVRLRACRRRPPELPPDSAAYLEIDERKRPETPPSTLFRGWMFASSPGLSALEHPVYDVIVLDCIDAPADDSDGDGADAGSGSE